MNKLKNKVFYTIFLIITLFSLSVVIIYNVRNYIEKQNEISNNLNIASGKKDITVGSKNIFNFREVREEKFIDGPVDKNFPMDPNIKFMDTTIYTVLIDENNNIKEIVNHSNNDLTNEQISLISSNILSKNKIKEKFIGCLYLEDYSYLYTKGESLIILDNKKIKNSLLIFLEISLLFLVVIEIITFFISKLITNWITEPVNESFERQKEFIADASHELKTPLSVIIAASDALEHEKTEMKWLKTIKNEANRMSTLITDLLDLTYSERKELLNMKNANISKTIELSLLSFEVKAYEENVKLKYELKENIYTNYDENSLQQLIEILLDNAIKHSKKKSTILVKLESNTKSIILTVTNEGKGIPKDEEEKIFERFYRVDKSRNRSENRYGLGLAIAKNIVENHNGTIIASSNEKQTTFKVILRK